MPALGRITKTSTRESCILAILARRDRAPDSYFFQYHSTPK